MKKMLIVAASALTIAAASPAFAQTATGEIALTATVAGACGVGNHKSGAAAAPGWDQSVIDVDLDNASGQFTSDFVVNNRSFGNVWCNGPANVILAVAPLTTSATVTDTGSFTNRFDVEVVTDAGVYVGKGENFLISTVGAGAEKAEPGETAGAFETGLQRYAGADSITVKANGLRPIAGTYNGYLRFTASPKS